MADFASAQYTIGEVNNNTNSKTAILTDSTNGLAAIKTGVNTANGYLTNSTYGLNAIKNAISSNGDFGSKNLRLVGSNSRLSNASSLTNLVNVSGRGKLYMAAIYQYMQPSSLQIVLKVIIDGTTVLYLQSSGTNSGFAQIGVINPAICETTQTGNIYYWRETGLSSSAQNFYVGDNAQLIVPMPEFIPFNSSLQVQYQGNFGSTQNSIFYWVLYSLA